MVSCYAFGAMFVLDLLKYAYTQKLKYKSDMYVMYVVLVRMHALLRLVFCTFACICSHSSESTSEDLQFEAR